MAARMVLRAALAAAVIAVGLPNVVRAQLAQPAFDQSSVFVVSLPDLPLDATAVVQQRSEKSPWLAGILSFFLPYGTGSFYAGNNSHGIRHLVIGGATAIGMGVSLLEACIDGFRVCDKDGSAYAIGGVFALGYLANWVWGTITAVSDANAYNRGSTGASLQPGILVLEPAPGAVGVSAAVGLRIGRVTF
ncbi:MAG: hypothetical protein OEQ75_13390 [Gemmatimonadota bacterium]|nr:hypothetical protein [Gemmatimonadota bacterium]